MEIIKEFIADYGLALLYTLVTAVFGLLGMAAKSLLERWLGGKIKLDTVRAAVRAVEQVARDIHGEEKLERAKLYVTEVLNEKGIGITQLELELLIEAAVNEFNNAFAKNEPEKA